MYSWLIEVHLVPSPVKQVTGTNCASNISGETTSTKDALGHISICLPQSPLNLFANNAQEQLNWSFQCNIHQGRILKGSGILQEQYKEEAYTI